MNILRALRSVRRRHLVVPAAVAALVFTASVPAWADDAWPDEGWVITPPPVAAPAAAPPPRADRERERRWYGWQPIVTDSLSVTVVPVLALSADKNNGAPAAALTVGSYLLAPAIIHIAHGRAGIAAASLGLRLGLPSAGFLLGATAAHGCGNGFCTAGSAAIGALVGVISASAIDAAALSWENPTSDDDASVRSEARGRAPNAKPISFTPLGGPRREGGFDVGIGAVF